MLDDAVDITQEAEMDQVYPNMEEEAENTQKFTQETYDPRRSGQSNSGLSESDLSDIICILHPASPAAFRVVAATALWNTQHILQNQGLVPPDPDSQVSITEQDTMLLESVDTDKAKDLALRFSSRVNDPAMGFCFGRNSLTCDIILEMGDQSKRLSNKHFNIYMNASGIVMLDDLSTNGTLVDNTILKGRTPGHPKTRMLNQGSIIQILSSTPDETLKFIVRYPQRHGHTNEYTAKFREYMRHTAIAEQRALAVKRGPPMPDASARGQLAAPIVGPPNPKPLLSKPFIGTANYGMHWDGGDKYRPVGLLGKGAFAIVYHVSDISTGECYAAKELEKKRFMKNGVLDLKIDNEMRIMQSLRHPSIVQYIDYKEEPDYLYIIMEYVPGGDLQGYMQSHRTLPEPLAREMTRQVLGSLAYLHQKNITHRDIKPDNILIASEEPFIVKLTDFGLSKVVSDGETMLKTFCGTLLYCAPEVFPHYDNYVSGRRQKRRRQGPNSQSKRRAYDQSVDIWSYAAVLWFVLCGKPPIEGVVDQTGQAMFTKIMETHLDTQPLRDHGISKEAIDLLVMMLNTDPAARPTELECLRQPWLNDGTAANLQPEPADLGPIHEEPEDLDASQLSIHDESDEEIKEPNKDEDALDLADLRKSKRFKIDGPSLPRSETGLFTSSEFSSLQSIPLVNDTAQRQAVLPRSTKPNRLFGEISQSALQSSSVIGTQVTPGLTFAQPQPTSLNAGTVLSHGNMTNVAKELSDQSTNPGTPQQESSAEPNGFSGARADESLLGAESLVRELHMESPEASHSETTPKQTTPRTPARSFNPSVGSPFKGRGNIEPAEDVTPKQPNYDRQINLPISTSLFYDTRSPNNHNFDSSNNPMDNGYPQGVVFTDGSPPSPSSTLPRSLSYSAFQSLPATEFASYPSSISVSGTHEQQLDNHPNKENEDLAGATMAALLMAPPEFIKPPPRLGKLVSTPDSFTNMTIPLTTRITTWGRNPNNTHVYPEGLDVRIPKCGIELWFHAKGIEKTDAARRDWTKLEGLHTVIRTRSSRGLLINGVHLRERDDQGRGLYGRVHNGDEVVVSWGSDGSRLAFQVLIAHGEGGRERAEGEVFKVLAFEDDAGTTTSASVSASSASAPAAVVATGGDHHDD